MSSYVANHSVATALVVVTVALWFLGELRQAIRRRSEASKADRGSLIAVRLSLYASFIIASLAASSVKSAAIGGGLVVAALGFALAWSGIAIRWSAFRALGRYFTISVMTSPDQPVVATGPYRFVRHPSYTGLTMTLIGLGVLFDNWLGLAALAFIPVGALLYRIRVEEAALASGLGTAYTDFAASRKRLVPYVW